MGMLYRPSQIKVPGLILLHDQLTASAKVLWAALQLHPNSQQELQDLSGLSRNSIKPGRDQLQRLSLLRPLVWTKGGYAFLPVDLLSSRGVNAQAKITYGAIQLCPVFFDNRVETTVDQLAQLTGRDHKTIRRALRSLVEGGWIEIHRPRRTGPFRIVVRNPHLEAQRHAIAAINRRLQKARHRGEALMREWLTLLIDLDNFEDDASPGFLVNPYTAEELQIDRLYPPNVGFEFNGPQHYGPTALYPDEEEARKQMGRDLIKQAICMNRGIHLVIVHAADLSLEGILRLIPDCLPLRNLNGQELVIAHLESLSRPYRQRALLPLPMPKKNSPGA